MNQVEVKEEIEDGIKGVVEFLQEHGFETFASCEGGPGHPRSRAWVRIGLSVSNDLSELRKSVAKTLFDGGYRGFTMVELYEHQKSHVCDTHSLVEVEFWSEQKPVFPEINMDIMKRMEGK